MKPSLAGTLAAIGAALAAAAPRPAAAHIQLTFPPQRTEAQKKGPCGDGTSARSAAVTEFRPGQTIVVEWDETVEHPGHFRISFDDDGDDDFAIPASYDESCSNGKVLVDLIPDRDVSNGDRHYRQEVTLPNYECVNCTLQVIQIMTDKPPYTADALGNDIYYQCSDITLRGRPAAPADAPACLVVGGGTSGAGGASGAGGVGNAGGGAGAGAAGAGGGVPAGQGGNGVDDQGGGDDGCSYGSARGRGAAWAFGFAAALGAFGARRRARPARRA
jgi:BIM1-like copper acquisition factor